jgi:hypothetical protein
MPLFFRIVSLFMPRKMKQWRYFRKTSSAYLDLTKSMIIAAIVVEHDKILPTKATAAEGHFFLCFLTSFFSVKTDIELENRGVPKEFRDDLWETLINCVLDEFGITEEAKEYSIETIATFMNQSAIVVTHSDTLGIDIISKTALKFISLYSKMSGENTVLDQENDIETINTRFAKTIEYYKSYSQECFDDIAKLF